LISQGHRDKAQHSFPEYAESFDPFMTVSRTARILGIAKHLAALLLCTLICVSASAQQRKSVSGVKYPLSHKVAALSNNSKSSLGTGSITIVALRVDFPDEGSDSGLTTGNGKFDLSSRFRLLNRDTVIDPPPHDSNYFLAHFQFLNNYFTQTSRGKLAVSSILLPGILRMSKQMKLYSPKRTDTTNTPLADLYKEAWTRADSLGLLTQLAQTLDTSRVMFVIFHAGAGRDIDLSSQFGFDPTPNDLPSIFFNERSLKLAFGDAFSGISVAGGKMIIRNTAVLPESETRTIPNPSNAQQTLVIQLGMNGLFASQVGSFIGLPDLFNTSNGKTAIGRLGLMDGEGIFGYSGIFPPEPMAWEKIRLGWITPIEVTMNDTLSIYTAVTAAKQGRLDQTIYKIPISADEYYLLEVRRRDANADGAVYSTYQATQGLDHPFNYIIPPGQYSYGDSITGVLTSADEYDFAAFQDMNKGGIAIWHVDESIIRANEANDAINADVDHRGIRLIEASGIPEIGVTIQTPFGNVTPSGYQGDLWFFNNPDRGLNDKAHWNEFSSVSLPPSKSNTGSPSYVKLTNFSPQNNVMSVVFQRDLGLLSEGAQPITGFPMNLKGMGDSVLTGIVAKDGTAWLLAGSTTRSNAATRTSLYLAKSAAPSGAWQQVINDSSTGAFVSTGYSLHDVVLRESGDGIEFYAAEDSLKEHRITRRVVNAQNVLTTTSIAFPFVAGPLMLDGSDTLVAGIQTAAGAAGLATYSADLQTRYSYTTSTGRVHSVARINSNVYTATSDSASTVGSQLYAIQNTSARIYAGLLASKEQSSSALPQVLIADASQSCVFDIAPTKEIVCASSGIEEAALANLEGDATLEYVALASDHLIAYNYSAAPASNLYFRGKIGSFSGNPIVIDIASTDPGTEVLFCKDGLLNAINASSGKNAAGFPLAAGKIRKLLALKRADLTEIFALADSATLLGWNVPSGPLGLAWPMERYDAARTSHAPLASSVDAITEFFPNKRAYVWPNPALHGDEAHIRLFVSKDATANCLIVNDAGERVASIDQVCQGGTDNEILWDTKQLGNGIYTCRLKVEAKSGGETAQKIIKIAVVK
jgi:M6 family metalloprotease-like protein